MVFGRRYFLDDLEMTGPAQLSQPAKERVTYLKRLIAARQGKIAYADSVRKAQEELDRL